MKRYSVAIYPSQQIIDLVKTMKGYLKSKIYWYNSCNSVAHITICEFEIDESQIDELKRKLHEICDTFSPFQVYLDDFSTYENGAFFITLNENSKSSFKPQIKKTQKPAINSKKKSSNPEVEKIEKKPTLKSIMKKTQETLRISNMKKSNDPHISVARRLTPEKIKIASQLFTTIESDFLCKEIVLREFDPIKKQYFVIETFPFGSNPKTELIQGTLF